MLRSVSLRSFNVGYWLRRSEPGKWNDLCLKPIRFHCFVTFFDSAPILACRAAFSVRSFVLDLLCFGDIFKYKNESNIMKLPAHHFALWLGHWELGVSSAAVIWIHILHLSRVWIDCYVFSVHNNSVFCVLVLWWWVWFLSVVKTTYWINGGPGPCSAINTRFESNKLKLLFNVRNWKT